MNKENSPYLSVVHIPVLAMGWMGSTNVIMTLWVRWKKRIKLAITLDPEHVEGAQDKGGNTGDNYTRVEMPFNSLMTEFLEGVIVTS